MSAVSPSYIPIAFALVMAVSAILSVVRFRMAASMFRVSRTATGHEASTQKEWAHDDGKGFVWQGVSWALLAVASGAAAYILLSNVW